MYVYRFLNSQNEIIYIGRTEDLHSRIEKQHFNNNGHLPRECYGETVKIEYCEFNNKTDMYIYEIYFINKFNPKFNTEYKNNETDISLHVEEVEWKEYVINNPSNKNKTKLKLFLFYGQPNMSHSFDDVYVISAINKPRALEIFETEFKKRWIWNKDINSILTLYKCLELKSGLTSKLIYNSFDGEEKKGFKKFKNDAMGFAKDYILEEN